MKDRFIGLFLSTPTGKKMVSAEEERLEREISDLRRQRDEGDRSSRVEVAAIEIEQKHVLERIANLEAELRAANAQRHHNLARHTTAAGSFAETRNALDQAIREKERELRQLREDVAVSA